MKKPIADKSNGTNDTSLKKPLRLKPLSIPVRYVDGGWEVEYGGKIAVEDGTRADLVVDRHLLQDQAFVERLTIREEIKVFGEGTNLRARLRPKTFNTLTSDRQNALIQYEPKDFGTAPFNVPDIPSGTFFINVKIGKASKSYSRRYRDDPGGLWMHFEGLKTVGIFVSDIILPNSLSDKSVCSLNHAYTLLSEIYETWRISHTGNCYQVFYYLEGDGLWYPLEFLRQAKLAKQEQKICHNLWQNFVAKVQRNPQRRD